MGAPTWRPVRQFQDATTRVESTDAIEMDVGVLEILPEAAMADLLRQRLAEDGWSKGQDGSMSRSIGEVTVTLSPDARTVTARATVARDVKVRVQTDADSTAPLAKASERAKREVEQAVAQKLGKAEADIRAGVQAALQKVYVEALQKKAAAMGEIESMHEGRGPDGELELTIKVRV
jgi:hypothetical protein